MAAQERDLLTLTEQIAAVLRHNSIGSAEESFPIVDVDQDDRISVNDLFETCQEVQIEASLETCAAWIQRYALQSDKSFLTIDAWRQVLDTTEVLNCSWLLQRKNSRSCRSNVCLCCRSSRQACRRRSPRWRR